MLFDMASATLPDLIVGESDTKWASLVITNATNKPRNDLKLVCRRSDGRTLTTSSVEGSKTQYDLRKFERILVTGFGKAAGPMACAAEEKLRDCLSEGVVIAGYDHGNQLERIRIREAGHPIPDANSLKGTRELTTILSNAAQDDLVIMLISGGGSALCTLPAEGIKLKDIQMITELLLKCGADIYEINTIPWKNIIKKINRLPKITMK